MDELQEVFYLTSLDQARTIADTLRVRLIGCLVRQPLTVTQLGDLVGETPAKVHYHVRELERIGVVRLVETREKGGILEKYYRAVAKNIEVSPDLLRTSPQSEVVGMINEWFQWLTREALKALALSTQQPENPEPLTFASDILWATNDEFRTLIKQVMQMIKALEDPRHEEGEHEWSFSIVAHQMVTARDEEAPSPVGDAPRMQVPSGMPSIPPIPPILPIPAIPTLKLQRSVTIAAGDIRLTRKDFEKAIAEGRPFDITLLGVLRIDDDVPAELVEGAIAHIRHIGKLIASPQMREALKAKNGGKTADS